jgi:hypothetical protein
MHLKMKIKFTGEFPEQLQQLQSPAGIAIEGSVQHPYLVHAMVVYILQPGTQSFYGNILNWTFLYSTYAEPAIVEAPS